MYILFRTNDAESTARYNFMWKKRRWRIETFYNFYSNVQHNDDFQQKKYYKIQGYSFVLLVLSLIHKEFAGHVRNAGYRIFFLIFIKACETWRYIEMRDKKPDQVALLEKLGTSLNPNVPASLKS